jgi:hypothetical protein
MMVLLNPCRRTTSAKKRVATLEASFVLEHGKKWAILKNLSTKEKIESWPRIVRGRLSTKSMLRSIHGWFGIGKGQYRPALVRVPLESWQVRHLLIVVNTSLLRWGQ